MSASRQPLTPVTIHPAGPSLAPDVLRHACRISAATLHEAAGKIGALPSAIKPAVPGFRVTGRAFTVHSPPADNLWLHRAIYAAAPGDVLVVYTSGHNESGYWGEVMSRAAKLRGLSGVVIDGCARDGTVLADFGIPVFSRGLCIQGTGKDRGSRGWLNAPVLIGDVIVNSGDLVVGDVDGVVVIPNAQAASAVAASADRDQNEAEILQRLEAGERTLDIYGLS